ncbi:MAG: hypothetical protein PHR52_11570 [Fermentimonas sp.]|nr:hypothetical protein [Fermentimonas sp.]
MDKQLKKIANFLVMNIYSDISPGLLKGKMGLAIFFYHYSRHINSSIYENVADHIIDDILANITPQLPLDIFDGIFGVSLGIKYLINNGYIENEKNDSDIFNIENKLFSLNLRKIDDQNINLSLSKFYVLSHMVAGESDKYEQLICDFLKTYNKFFTGNTLFEIPMPIISSLLFFISTLEKNNLYQNEIEQLKLKVFAYLSARIESDKENKAEMLVLKQLIQRMNFTLNDEITGILFNQFKDLTVDESLSFQDFTKHYLWQNLLYDLECPSQLFSDIVSQEKIDNLLSDTVPPLPIFQGITSIGLYILKQKLQKK